MVTVQFYNEQKHGPCDDCEFVIIIGDDNGDEFLAEMVADRLGLCAWQRFENKLYCCHA